MSESKLEVINSQTEDNITGIVIDGKPYLYWLRVYKALGLKKEHAPKIITRLKEGIHYIKFSKEEFVQLSGTVSNLATVDTRAKSFYFLTQEGYNRAILEIGTEYMQDKEIAAMIEAKKDDIARIYTRYEQGEVLSIDMDSQNQPTIPLYAPVALVLEDQLAIARLMIGEGVEPAIARTMAFSVTEDITQCGDTLIPWKKLIVVDPTVQEPAMLTPTDIGKNLGGISAITINRILVNLGYQKKVGSEWVPTELGKSFSRFIPQEIQHNRGLLRHMQLKWIPSVVDNIREILFPIRRSQQTLVSSGVS